MPKPKRHKRAGIVEYVLDSMRPRFDNPLLVKGSFLFLSDFEIPFHNAKFINECFAVAHAYGIRQCVWGGDAMHFEAFSPFVGADSDADAEITEIDEHLPQFLEPFDKIIWLMGNHDDRPQRAFDRKIKAEQALRIAVSPENQLEFKRKVTMSPHYWCYAAHRWQLEHQKNYSNIPARVAQQLTAKYHCHVITAHTHHQGGGVYNGFYAIDSGCGVDVKKLAYTNLRHSIATDMQNGAVIMLEWGGQYVPIPLEPSRMDFELCRARKK